LSHASRTIGNESRDFRPRHHDQAKPRRHHVVDPLHRSITEEAVATTGAKQRLFLALLQSRNNCRPLMRKHDIFTRRGKDDSRFETNEQNRVGELLTQYREGTVSIAMAVEFIGRLKTYTARREIVPFFLRGVVKSLREKIADTETFLRFLQKASELEILANEIEKIEGDPNRALQMTEKSAIQERLENILA